ncbi:unnamed protein product [Tilletia controversa]|nr:unnamed protein product [Tilletia controversa]CAD6919724.1 unnamed protein product [Tilletia controversa]CAD6973727.1 unnamed protein product [Tilletia controversa]
MSLPLPLPLPLPLLQQTWLASRLSSALDHITVVPASVGKRPAFIGIVIAITANIIISLALNVQKMAHIRLQQEQQQQEQQRYEEEDDEHGFDGYEDEEDDEEERVQGDGAHPNTRFRVQVDTIQEESESPSASARTSQLLTPGPPSSEPPSPSPAPRSKLSANMSMVQDEGQQQQSHERSGSSTEVDSAPSPPISASKAKLQHPSPTSSSSSSDGDNEALLLSRRSSHHSNTTGTSKPSPNTKFLRSRLWWCGIGLMTLGEAGNFISYGFAPASLVAPLGAVALLSNVLIAPVLLHEKFRPRDLGGIFLAIVGAVTVVFSSRTDDVALGPDGLLEAIRRGVFLVYMGVVLCLGAVFAGLSLTRLGDQFVLLDVGTCAIFGGFTVLSTKGISSMLSAGPSPFALLRHPITYILVFVLASTAVLQITFLNRALQRFDSRQVIPTMFTLFTIMAIVGSAVLYRDFEDMDAHRLINFLFGCGTTFAGVFLLTRRHEDEEEDGGQGQGSPQQGQEAEEEEVEGREHRDVLGDVEEEEEEEEVDDGREQGGPGAEGTVTDADGLVLPSSKTLVAEPDTLSIQSSATAATATDLLALGRRPVPTHTQSSPTAIPSIHAPAMVMGNNAAGRRGRTTTALDGTGTAFLAAGSPPGMIFALGNAGSRAGAGAGVDWTQGGAGLEGTSAGGNLVAVPIGGARLGSSSAISVPVTPARGGGAGTGTGTGGGLLPVYRTPRLSLMGSGSGSFSGSNAAGGVVGPSASIRALSGGQLLLLATTPAPSAVPILMGPSSHLQQGQGLGIGYASGGGGGGMARSLPPGADGIRSRTMSQPSTPVPGRRRSRKGLRADAAAAAQGQGQGRERERERSESQGRENYAKGQGSWTERQRPGMGAGAGAGAAGASASTLGSSTGVGKLPQRRSVISLFGGWSGSGSASGSTSHDGPAPSPPPPGPSMSAPLARSQSQTRQPGGSSLTRPPGMARDESAGTSTGELSPGAREGAEQRECEGEGETQDGGQR